jgi:hypothetical protein
MLCSGRTKPQSVFDSLERQTGYEVPLPASSILCYEKKDPRQRRKEANKMGSKHVMNNLESGSVQMGSSANQTKDSFLLEPPPLFADRSIQLPVPQTQHRPNLAVSQHRISKQESPVPSIVTTTQHQQPESLPFPVYPATSQRQKIYNPMPVTKVYQLDRFLDEIPDFRSISLSGDQAKGRNERHKKALKTRLRVLDELL